LISNVSHASEIFTTPIANFKYTPDQQKIVAPIGLQILSQIELMEVASAKPIKEIVSKQATKS
jgi:hypothetical protein